MVVIIHNRSNTSFATNRGHYLGFLDELAYIEREIYQFLPIGALLIHANILIIYSLRPEILVLEIDKMDVSITKISLDTTILRTSISDGGSTCVVHRNH